ncbi:hypothetical protein ColLi_07742 [Colletotrichum liriopes]|uniref:Uncharacterized protein n=1 Tax=Colletotrichum liriopes TaxID=708192 RepID=A0AA37GQF9_9PEZI|nr:hypothetical protein ColLi_07742 [Colletotrichum liriopes]
MDEEEKCKRSGVETLSTRHRYAGRKTMGVFNPRLPDHFSVMRSPLAKSLAWLDGRQTTSHKPCAKSAARPVEPAIVKHVLAWGLGFFLHGVDPSARGGLETPRISRLRTRPA